MKNLITTIRKTFAIVPRPIIWSFALQIGLLILYVVAPMIYPPYGIVIVWGGLAMFGPYMALNYWRALWLARFKLGAQTELLEAMSTMIRNDISEAIGREIGAQVEALDPGDAREGVIEVSKDGKSIKTTLDPISKRSPSKWKH